MSNTELIDRLSSQWDALDPVDEWRLDITEAIRTIEAQALEIESLRVDAKRYRWLLDKSGFGIRRNGVRELSFAFYVWPPDHINELNEAIDADIAAKRNRQQPPPDGQGVTE